MSIKLIEKSYNYFLDKEMSGPQMSVLQALAYCANYDSKKCFPSDAYLAKLTHLGDKTVERARKALRDKHKVIKWKRGGKWNGGNIANHYEFTFPDTDERYETVTTNPPSVTLTPSQRQSDPTQRQSDPAPPSERRSNTEYKPEINSKSNTETCPTHVIEFKLNGCSDGEKPKDPFDHATSSPLKAALALCGVDDDPNKKTFGKYMGEIYTKTNSMVELWDIVDTLRSEVKQGEHKNARNLPGILTKRLVTRAQQLGVKIDGD